MDPASPLYKKVARMIRERISEKGGKIGEYLSSREITHLQKRINRDFLYAPGIDDHTISSSTFGELNEHIEKQEKLELDLIDSEVTYLTLKGAAEYSYSI